MPMKRVHFTLLTIALLASTVHAEKLPYAESKIVPPTPEWKASVTRNAPAEPTVKADKKKVLVFSLFTGFNHLVIPHVNEVFKILGSKSGVLDIDISVDIESLTPDSLSKYDVLVLNNNCSVGGRRNLFLDVLEKEPKYADMTDEQRQAKSDALEQAMLDFVSDGKGLVVVHGAPVLLNNSEKFTSMVGAAFDYHPPNQEVTIRTVDENHPLVAAFKGKGPFIHRDEPYCFKNAYERFEFRPLLSMDIEGMKDSRNKVGDIPRYVAWIKRHGKGRVFYCSPSHFPETYESPTMLQFILDGTQYAAGDLKCDDTAMPKAKAEE